MSSQAAILIMTLGAVTYFTRFSGYLLMRAFTRIPPRVEAALNAVPAAVLTAIVAPSLVKNGPMEAFALLLAAAASLRFGLTGVVLIGVGFVILMRNLF